MSRPKGARVVIAGLFAALLATASQACTTLPNQLTNGSTADASQVMADFNGIVSCPLFSGKVGIGTQNPQATLQVGEDLAIAGNQPTLGMNTAWNGDWHYLTSNFASIIFLDYTDGGISFDVAPPGAAGASVTNFFWNALFIKSNGDVGIGGTANPTYPLYVNGTAYATGGWSSPSDGRLKKHVVEIGDALALVERLRGVRFEWRAPGEREIGQSLDLPLGRPQLGLVAQEVGSVLPEAVTTSSGPDGLYGLKEYDLVPVLVEAIKEQQSEIASLKAEVVRLEATSASLAQANAILSSR